MVAMTLTRELIFDGFLVLVQPVQIGVLMLLMERVEI